MDDLSIRLNNLCTRCNINNVYVDHPIYADDMVLLVPSPIATEVIYEYEVWNNEHAIAYNVVKTVCMAILLKWLKSLTHPVFVLNNSLHKYVAKQKYISRCTHY